MESPSRRQFLKYLGLTLGASSLRPPLALAGHTPTPVWGTIPPFMGPNPPGPVAIWNTSPNVKVLEIHLYGGLSPWETFYVRAPQSGADRYREFDTEMGSLTWGNCAAAYSPNTMELLFDQDDLTHDIYLGPMTRPLWTPAILDRMRLVVLKHDLEPHEAAIPYALTGFKLGSPNLASLGTSIQHHYVHSDIVNNVPTAVPYSYVCWPDRFLNADNLQASAAVGSQPGYSKPVVLTIRDDMSNFLMSLERLNVGADHDRLFAQYRAQYKDVLRYPAGGDQARSRGFDAYDASAGTLVNATSLHGLLNAPASPITGMMPRDGTCPTNAMPPSAPANMPGQALLLAAYLLSQPGPRYVGVIDNGLITHIMGGGYDTHATSGQDHHVYTAMNLWNVLVYLRQLIDAGTIDLNETMIVLTTEFGRTPGKKGTNGRDHWPWGYVNVLIGGPVQRGIAGAILDAAYGGVIADDDGYAADDHHYWPSDLRAAVLLAAGIFPFEAELFGVRDMSFVESQSNHWDLMMTLKTEVLGADANA